MTGYRVWTKDWRGGVTVHTEWMSRSRCRGYILSRWGHWPSWAYISKAQTAETFVHANGD